MSANNGGPAFPMADPFAFSPATEREAKAMAHGMALRDYFAAKAMQGLFDFWVAVNSKTTINDPDAKIIAEMAYEYADAMLKAREQS